MKHTHLLGLTATATLSCATSAPNHPHDDGKTGHAGHHQPGGMQHDFHDAAHWVTVFDAPDRAAWQKPDEVVRLMAIPLGGTVADIGAGTGYFLPYLSAAVGPTGHAFGLDVEPSLVEYMTQRIAREGLAPAQAKQIGFDDPGLPPSSVDRILIVNTWHHIDGREAYAGKLALALRPGGTVTIVDFTLTSEQGPAKEHRLSPEQVSTELAGAGLVARVVDETLPDQYVLIATRP